MSIKGHIITKILGETDEERLADCIDAGIESVAKMGHVSPEVVRQNFDKCLMGFTAGGAAGEEMIKRVKRGQIKKALRDCTPMTADHREEA